MLAAIDWLQSNRARFEFVAIAPRQGRLAEALCERRIPIADWSLYDSAGRRRSAEQLQESLAQIVTDLKPMLLHANSLAMGRLAGQLKRLLTIPTTAHLRDIINLSASSIADLNANDRLIAVSIATRDHHIGQGMDAARITVVRNGVDLEHFRSRPPTGTLLNELNLSRVNLSRVKEQSDPAISRVNSVPQEFERPVGQFFACSNRPKLIATIGQIGLRKGQEILAAAAPTILQHVKDAHFILIGERSSQKQESIEFETNILRAFKSAGLSDRLHRLGYRDDVDLLLNEIDVLVHPAHQEPFGRVLLEASASGVPIVATNVGGTSEIVVDGITGLLVPRADPQALATAVIGILTDHAMAADLRKAARQHAENHFSISTAAKNLAAVWNELLDGRAAK